MTHFCWKKSAFHRNFGLVNEILALEIPGSTKVLVQHVGHNEPPPIFTTGYTCNSPATTFIS